MSEGITVLSLFDGISCGMVALKRAGVEVKAYYASEIDPWAIAISQTQHPEIKAIGNVKKVSYENGILHTEKGDFDVGKIDLVIGGSPCTNFSFTGKRMGMVTSDNQEVLDLDTYLKLKDEGYEFQGQSYLFFEYVRLLRETNPRNFLLENVVMGKKWEKVITNILKVEPQKINSSLVSAQNRPRIYWSNMNVGDIQDKGITVNDILTSLPEKCYRWMEQSRIDKINSGGYKYHSMYRFAPFEGKSACVLCDGYHNSSDNKIKFADGRVRYLCNEENERLQTLPYGYTSGIPETRRKHAIGNGWTVDVIVEFFKHLKDPVFVQGELPL